MGLITSNEKLGNFLIKYGGQLLLLIVLLLSKLQDIERIQWMNELIVENDWDIPLESYTNDIIWAVVLGITILIWLYLMIRDFKGYEKV